MAASRRRTPDPLRIAAARISGTVERCVVARGLTEDQALVEIGASLAAVPEVRWRAVLDQVAARYVDGTAGTDRAAMDLLVRAGADPERARAARASRGQSFLIR